MTVFEKDKEVYIFNIVAEAKMQALVIMTKKCHPSWNDDQVKDFLFNLLKYSIEKVNKSG